MNKEFIPYEEALALKELGFDESCFGYYNSSSEFMEDFGKKNSNCNKPGMNGKYCTAPTYSQAFRWFREKYGLDSYIIPARLETKKVYDYYIWFTNEKYERDLFIGMNNQYTYKEAELACLKKLIEIVKAKQ